MFLILIQVRDNSKPHSGHQITATCKMILCFCVSTAASCQRLTSSAICSILRVLSSDCGRKKNKKVSVNKKEEQDNWKDSKRLTSRDLVKENLLLICLMFVSLIFQAEETIFIIQFVCGLVHYQMSSADVYLPMTKTVYSFILQKKIVLLIVLFQMAFCMNNRILEFRTSI